MKKMMIVALMAAAASTAYAGDSPALKSILKAKTYAEAQSLVSSSLSQLANAGEKAKAYNKLVDLAMDGVAKEQAVINANQMAEQLGQGKVEAYDTLSLYNNLSLALDAAQECEKYDVQPNEKGKVAPKFHKKNQDRLYALRPYLINAGIYYQDHGDQVNAYKYLAGYVDSAESSLFAEMDKSKDENLTNIAYYAAVYAYQNKDIAKVDKYADIAMGDAERAKEAMNLKLAVSQENLKTKADSLAFVEKLETIYAQNNDNDMVFGSLVNMYNLLGQADKMEALFNSKLAADPNNFTVWAIRGQNAMIAQNLEEAIEDYKKALVAQPDNAQVLTYLGACLLDRAAQAEDRAAGKTGRVAPAAMQQIMPIYEEALTTLEKAKQLDPTRANANWAYPLYRCYYRVYGADDARTKDAELDTK